MYFLRANIKREVWLIVLEWGFQGEIWLCSILLRRSVVYFLRANIKGEVWLIVLEWGFQGGIWLCSIVLRRGVVYFLRANIKGEVWLIKFSRRDMVVCQLGNFISTHRHFAHPF